MIESLWAGWRIRYLSALAPKVASNNAEESSEESSTDHGSTQSVFTRILKSGLSDEETYIVHRGERVFAILNAYPYSAGHLMVLPYREVANLEDLTHQETEELWSTVTTCCRAIRTEYSAPGINVGINMGAASGGSVDEHLHVHIVPRWVGDSNFLTATANAKAIPEALDVSATRLRRAILDTLNKS
jgi:ATP adenylyltransferase